MQKKKALNLNNNYLELGTKALLFSIYHLRDFRRYI